MNWWNLIKQNDPKMVDPAEQEEMDKALVGGQKGLDKDKDGDIDAKDFKALRDGAMKKTMDEFLLAIDNLVRKGRKVGFFDFKNHLWREIDTREEYDDLVNIFDQFL